MNLSVKLGRLFYAIAISAIGLQQFYNADFHPMILPPLHSWLPFLSFWAYFTGTALLIAGVAIIKEIKPRTVGLVLGTGLLLVFIFYYIPYELIIDPYYKHLGEWGDAEKEMALAGGAFLIAGSFPDNSDKTRYKKAVIIRFPERIIPFGRILFAITMISFGVDHFLYTKLISPLVPSWIPGPVFWTYFTAVALIGAGIAIIFNIKLKLIASLLGIMIMFWFIFLHMPRVISLPYGKIGNPLTSALSALAFSGIAFVIAGTDFKRNQL